MPSLSGNQVTEQPSACHSSQKPVHLGAGRPEVMDCLPPTLEPLDRVVALASVGYTPRMVITSMGQGPKALPARIFGDAEALGEAVAREILAGIEQAGRLGRRFLLGCPGGRSGRPVYRALGRGIAQRRLDVRHLVIVMMDNYVVPSGRGFVHCPDEAHYSCRRFALDEIRDVLTPPGGTVPPLGDEQIWLPDPADPLAYEARIVEAGGIDLFILASGAGDGHVAFNPPGSSIDSPCRVVELAEQTRRDNLRTFPEFRSTDQVPRHGVTVGIATITRLSRAAALVIHGSEKHQSVRRLHACSGYDASWPVSCVFACRSAQVYLDTVAAGEELNR